MYQLFLYLHVICAVIWVGGAAYAQLLAFRVARSPDPMDLPKLAHHIETIGTWVFLPAAVLLFLAATLLMYILLGFGFTLL